MSKRSDHIDLCRDVLRCPNADECAKHGAMFAEELEDGGVSMPAPHIGGEAIDEKCVLILAQNPHEPKPGEPKLHADTPEGYLMDRHRELKYEHRVSGVVEDLGLDWDHLVWDNVVKCPSHENELHDVLFENCKHWTDLQIDILDPVHILAMGQWAVRRYFGLEYGQFEPDQSTMYHYSYLKRFGGYDSAITQFRKKVHPELPDVVLSE